ncbi:DUF423 domain-containing protein [Breoghania sp.]|uniref:DUF423 domain-containing protein n=1 Tax=Breoghania sp. TaxID=2065378 RepID=UPI0029C9FBD5|nr:DUF423 domain-containing protein [Breoghania sp.]
MLRSPMRHPPSAASLWPALAAGLSGAAGVALSAVAAHIDSSGFVSAAAAIALAHAPILLILCLPGIRDVLRLPALPAFMITLGVFLFCGDMSARVFLDHKLFAYAAPTGGSLLILGWLAIAALALPALLGRGGH